MLPVIAIPWTSKIADYEASVRRAGGEPHVVEVSADSPADVIAGAAGLLLAGGGDVLPGLYGESTHPLFSAAEPGRDEFEIELIRRALEADIPVFAICRGVQVLNVACGGTLVQDIPDQAGQTINHMVRQPADAIAHDVQIAPASLLATLLRPGGERCAVNSRHHQAPKALGTGVVATALAPDGIIEALENPTRRFCLGVQWHPENFWRTGEFQPLFEGFVRACGG
jgi:putative glutamine amidotransferase